jgi:hypothetical protein
MGVIAAISCSFGNAIKLSSTWMKGHILPGIQDLGKASLNPAL